MRTQRMTMTPSGYRCDLCGNRPVNVDHVCAVVDAAARPKTEPAVGQIRKGRLAYQSADRLWTIVEMLSGSAYVQEDGRKSRAGVTESLLSSWPCVGIETPAGRVMVGERRRVWPSAAGDRREGDFLDFEVCHVMSDARVWIADGAEGWPETAAKVAAWSLSGTGPLAKAAESAERKPWEAIAEARRMGHGLLQPDVVAEILGLSLDAVAMPQPIPRMPMPECAHLFPPLPTNPPDPRLAREQRRREIDAVLREDARRFPAFATARRAAVLAMVEAEPDLSTYDARTCLDMAHGYERRRGGLSIPRKEATDFSRWHCCTFEIPLQHYERARGMA